MGHKNGKNGTNGALQGEVFHPAETVAKQARVKDWSEIARRALSRLTVDGRQEVVHVLGADALEIPLRHARRDPEFVIPEGSTRAVPWGATLLTPETAVRAEARREKTGYAPRITARNGRTSFRRLFSRFGSMSLWYALTEGSFRRWVNLRRHRRFLPLICFKSRMVRYFARALGPFPELEWSDYRPLYVIRPALSTTGHAARTAVSHSVLPVEALPAPFHRPGP